MNRSVRASLIAVTVACAPSSVRAQTGPPTPSASVRSVGSSDPTTNTPTQPAVTQPTNPTLPTTVAPDANSGVRRVIYHPRDLVALRTRVRYSTLIVLPDGEQVVEATCGDRDRWLVNVRDGLVSVKPTQAGIASNLNLVTTSGAVYAFLLAEHGETSADSEALDLTVYLEREDTALHAAAPDATRPRFVPAEQVEDFRQQADLAREQAARATAQARGDLEAGLAAYRATYPLSMRFPYRIDRRNGPFRIRAMWHDDHRTFIQATARELPALYEYADRLPALVNFDVKDGTYVVPKVIRDGYLQLGAVRLGFRTQEGQ